VSILDNLRPRLFAWTFGVLLAAFVLPVAFNEHLPMQDLPNHLAIVRTLAARADPGWGEHFVSSLGPRPYMTYYGLCLLFSRVASPEAANRIVLCLTFLLLPLSFLYLVRSIDPARRWISLFAFPLLYSDAYFMGFTTYLLSLPPLLFSAGLAIRLAKRPSGGYAEAAALAATAVLLYFTHPFTLVLSGVVGAALALRYAHHLRRVLWAVVPFVPSAVLLAVWAASTVPAAGEAAYLPFGFKAQFLGELPLLAVGSELPILFWPAALLLVYVVLWWIWRRWRGPRVPGEKSPWPVFLLLLVGYFAVPFVAAGQLWFDLRLGIIVWLLLAACAPPELLTPRTAKVAVLAFCALSLFSALRLHVAFGREARPLFSLIATLEPGKRVLPILLDPESQAVRPFFARAERLPVFTPYAHFASYYHVEKGGESPFMTFHAVNPWVPLTVKSPLYRTAFRISDPFEPRRLLRQLPEVAANFDLILVRGGSEAALRWIERFAAPRSRSGPFAAFAVRR
jgi:hypothetical protein